MTLSSVCCKVQRPPRLVVIVFVRKEVDKLHRRILGGVGIGCPKTSNPLTLVDCLERKTRLGQKGEQVVCPVERIVVDDVHDTTFSVTEGNLSASIRDNVDGEPCWIFVKCRQCPGRLCRLENQRDGLCLVPDTMASITNDLAHAKNTALHGGLLGGTITQVLGNQF